MHERFSGRLRAALIGGGASLILAAGALAAPAFAADQPTQPAAPQAIDPHTHQLHGTVKTGGSTSFTVTTERYGDVAVSFTGTTASSHGNGRGHGNNHGHAHAHQLASPADLTAGERVVVQGMTSADGKTFLARRVHVLPVADGAGTDNGGTNGNSNAVVHLVGDVTSATTTSLTLKLADGTSQSVTLSADTRIRPRGKTVADLTVGTDVTVVTRSGVATGIVVMPA